MSSALVTYDEYLEEFKTICTEDVYLIKISSKFIEIFNEMYTERMILGIRHMLKFKKLKFDYPHIAFCRQEVEKDKKIIQKTDIQLTSDELRQGLVNDYGELTKFLEKNSEFIRKSTQTVTLKRIQVMIGLISDEKDQLHQFFNDIHELFPQFTGVNLLRLILLYRKDFGDPSNVENIVASYCQQFNLTEPAK